MFNGSPFFTGDTPLYPSNRRTPQTFFRPPYNYYDTEDDAYMRALAAHEQREREAATRSAYGPFGFALPNPVEEEEEEDEGVYIPRGRRGNYDDALFARRRAEHERQLRESAHHRHLVEQRRLAEEERLARSQQHQHAAHLRAQQLHAEQMRKRKSPSPASIPVPLPTRPAARAQPPPRPTPPTLEQTEAAANTIQAAYRAHQQRTRAHASLDAISRKVTSLLSSFQMPPTLDFDLSAPSAPSFAEEDGEGETVPKLLYNAQNTPVHAQEHALTQLLQKLDGVESNGDLGVRGRRKGLVGKIERALREMEGAIRAAWGRQHGAGAVPLEPEMGGLPAGPGAGKRTGGDDAGPRRAHHGAHHPHHSGHQHRRGKHHADGPRPFGF
ncbi:hypothetical protein DACRYDRAFT_23245 [Dacryopinax primogenitus]|uniref:BAG domain-containing protein n=1 Tax=Dacryopinax primogenitus (strain DJM 731) TaxID=1858805 RepID=M5FX52_DACPD|nr:uncharacterized protein DACRYDRAFT_23245 [Dacryopinax primogenitus]EJU00315.1 hypothetical protein DACRYDRAFT_23245 [Dacryopinax primogenitus]